MKGLTPHSLVSLSRTISEITVSIAPQPPGHLVRNEQHRHLAAQLVDRPGELRRSRALAAWPYLISLRNDPRCTWDRSVEEIQVEDLR